MASDVTAKWGSRVAERGFSQVPNYLLHLNVYVNDHLKLSPAEMIVLLQLVGAWWKKDEMPFPSMMTLADRSHLSERQIQRSIKSLEEKGYLSKKRDKNSVIASNRYDLEPLVSRLNLVADSFENKYPRKIKGSTPERDSGAPSKKLRRVRREKTSAFA